MWGHCIVLLSPDREKHVALMVVAKKQYRTATTALRESNFSREYQDWYLLSFAVAYRQESQGPAKLIDAQIPEPGCIIDVVA